MFIFKWIRRLHLWK